MIEIVHVGIGPLGQMMVRSAASRAGFRIAGAVDTDPAKIGKDLGELCAIERLGIAVSGSLDEAIRGKAVRVAVVTTVSSLAAFESQVVQLAQAKLHIVSTCEELFYPWRTQPKLAQRIDKICRDAGIACIGTGVNPGYMMDFLPTTLSGLCQKVTGVRVWRIQDASVRRIPFQQKIGAGLTREQFQAKVDDASVRHVGLTESISMIADALNWKLDRITDDIQPRIATETVTSEFLAE